MKTGAQYKQFVNAYHGRPMHCARPMTQVTTERIKREGSYAGTYRCPCGHLVRLYFNPDGTLHVNQQRRPAGVIPRVLH